MHFKSCVRKKSKDGDREMAPSQVPVQQHLGAIKHIGVIRAAGCNKGFGRVCLSRKNVV